MLCWSVLCVCAVVVLVFLCVVWDVFEECCLLIIAWCVVCALCLDDVVVCGVGWVLIVGVGDWVGIVFGDCVCGC